MKKSLFVLPAIAFACAANAQSSVTLFGVVDATLTAGKGSLSDRTQLGRGGLTTNRLGFRGTEDLGGGLSAGFWLEAGFNPDDGQGLNTNTNNQASGTATAPSGTQGLTFGRRATVSLASKTWGELRVGRDYVPQYWGMFFGDPFGNVGVGAIVNYTTIITGFSSTRASNSIGYWSPDVAGFRAHLMHYRGENASNVATADDGTGTGLRVTYGAGRFNIGAAYARTDYAAGDVVQRNISADWDFQLVKLMGVYNSDRNGALTARGAALGAVVPVGAGQFKAAYSYYRTSAVGRPQAKKLSLGYVHNLSKRTAVYGTYARVRNSGGSAHALNGATTAANASSSGFDLGLRHSF